MASSFYEIFQESGLKQQMANGWGHAYSDRSATSSASPPAPDSYETSNRSHSRQSRKSSSSTSSAASSSRKKSSKKDTQSSRSSKSSRTSRTGNIKEEDDEGGEEDQEMQRDHKSSRPRSQKHSQASSTPKNGRAYGYGDDAGGRDCFGGLSAELTTLRMHLLQRAGGDHQLP